MPKIRYIDKRFSASSRTIIDQANDVIEEYTAQGFDLTLRQLYYQFVSRDLLPNTPESYKRLGGIINDARLAGLVDWEVITDRTRNLSDLPHWSSPGAVVEACASQFRYDKWKSQPCRVEVWIEKEALAGVFERVCQELDVPFFSCRGYTSQSEMWSAGRRLAQHKRGGQQPIILHFGDHDPSGLDMSRDIKDRLKLFMGGVQFERLALNMAQVEEYSPPPNPAKTSDARFEEYQQEYGDESWELDALDPTVLAGLVRDRVIELRDEAVWETSLEAEREARRLLGRVAEEWDRLTRRL